MESSAISLFFSLLRKPSPEADPEQRDYLINLIDSPGHVDFSSEVSTASRLCDGAIVLVDAVEGVCSQTIAVLRQSWTEHLKPILVINKMDRLVTELKMSPNEAYVHLSRLLEQVNAVMGSFFQGERMEEDLRWRERLETKLGEKTQDGTVPSTDDPEDAIPSGNDPSEWEEKGDEDIYFEPERGNVIFSSAIDGFAFTVKQFAAFYEKKLGIKRSLLEKVLWGDFYLDPKTKRILGSKHLKGRPLKPMFVQFVLETIWAVYDASVGGDKGKGDPAKVEKITKALSISLPAHVTRSRDPRTVLTALFQSWIPLSTATLVSVIEHLPSPKAAQAARTSGIVDSSPGGHSTQDSVRNAMQSLAKSKSNPLVAFVSKMVSVPEKDLPENKSRSVATLTADEARELGRKKRAEVARAQAAANGERPDIAELRETLSETNLSESQNGTEVGEDEPTAEKERLIGFARLFSGTLEVGDEVFVLSPKFTPESPHAAPVPQKVTVTALYLMMGRELEPLTKVPPGVVFGIGGLEGHVMKSATLCSQIEGAVNLAGVTMGGQPIVRVALEPENPMDLDKMVKGMRLLEQSDPCAAYEVLDNGEHVILTAGELHLERCLKDLRERFAQCEIQVGAPIVPYRESIVSAAEMNPPKNPDLSRGTVTSTSNAFELKLRVRPLPAAATSYLSKNAHLIRDLYADQHADDASEADLDETDGNQHAVTGGTEAVNKLEQLKSGLLEILSKSKGEKEFWSKAVGNIFSFGPRRNGPNVFIDATGDAVCNYMTLNGLVASGGQQADVTDSQGLMCDIINKVVYAFQLSMSQGPLCAEPVQGVAVVLESCRLAESGDEKRADSSARLTGEVIRAVRESISKGFLDWSPRLLMAMYSCEIQASTEVLGRVYGVVARRRGRILAESMNEGTPFFTITAVLPVAESFGFSEEIRKRTSGAASPQLLFSGYEMLDEDPFWVPFTEEELEDLGELADRENVAKKYMDGVRKRKGMFVQGKKLVESAEKQKTLKK